MSFPTLEDFVQVSLKDNFKLSNYTYQAKKHPHWKLYRKNKNDKEEIPITPIRGDQIFQIKSIDLICGYYTIILSIDMTIFYQRNFYVSDDGKINWFNPSE